MKRSEIINRLECLETITANNRKYHTGNVDEWVGLGLLTEPENTLFGVTNSITRAAQGYEGEDKYHLERVGVKVLTEGLRSRN